MRIQFGQVDDGVTVAATTAASASPQDHDPVDIWPFIKAGVISGMTVWFLTRWLGGGR